MKRYHEEIVTSWMSVDDTLTKHNNAWSAIPAFTSAVSRFRTVVSDLNPLLQANLVHIGGFAKSKRQQRAVMINLALQIGAQLSLLAEDTGDATLADRVRYSRTELAQLADLSRSKVMRLIARDAADHAQQLVAYNIGGDVLTAFEESIASFENAIPAPRLAAKERKIATAAIGVLIAEGGRLVKRMRKMLLSLAVTAPAFVADLREASLVVHSSSGARHKPGSGAA